MMVALLWRLCWFLTLLCNVHSWTSPFYNSHHTQHRHTTGECSSSTAGSSTRIPSRVVQLSSTKHTSAFEVDFTSSVLHEHGYAERLVTISESYDLPIVAELYQNGKARLGVIIGIQFDPSKDPLFKIQLTGSDEVSTVDVGQITTIWDSGELTDIAEIIQIFGDDDLQKGYDSLPVGRTETSMDGIYKNQVGKSRSSTWGLTKKQIVNIARNNPDDPTHTEQILRQVIKTGHHYARLVDSTMVMTSIFGDKVTQTQDARHQALCRYLAADALAQDAKTGGRFKRLPCILVTQSSGEISIINGGWIVQDQSVRAGQEAQKFVGRNSAPSTAADQRILKRLECLAMGQAISLDQDGAVELDVREALKAMDLPTTPNGAKAALIRTGRWQIGDERNAVNPWPIEIVNAAKWYQEMDSKRRVKLSQATASSGVKKVEQQLEGRSDLTKLPCVCVDAARTSFRDDAIGIRPRAKTGRKIVGSAKWELLIHIADVSDIYAPQPNVLDKGNHLTTLKEAAASRGASRYDLPLGPLHLLPPLVLRSLAFQTLNADRSKAERTEFTRTVNRCVTLWVYIDDKTGKILDAGVERSLIGRPLALSFQTATALLDGKMDPAGNEVLARGRSILVATERLLSAWSQSRLRQSDDARDRETRLSMREAVSKEIYSQTTSDDGRDGFTRTRGHKLVDSALEIYSHGITTILNNRKASIPRVAGTNQGRTATAPLRRYIDAMMQRQTLAVLCDFGGEELTRKECAEIGKVATDAINSLANVKSVKSGTNLRGISKQQRTAIRDLQMYMRQRNGPVPAVGTGRQGEVVIQGVGAIASCRGLKRRLKAGEKLMVHVRRIDEALGVISVVSAEDGGR